MAKPLVTVREGKLRGSVKEDFRGDSFYSFQGIPYAKPPLGELRFKAPQPAEKWEGIRDATEEGSECYAKHFGAYVGSEDCLFINVFTKKIESKTLKPVMFWLHGGGFNAGSGKSQLYGPEYLMVHDVVLITMNYRVGVLGFLSLSDSSLEVPGNAGLKDMVMALKWVQNNIQQFSGDPNNVTIFGESAGGAAVHYLLLSPATKGLFHKAIAQSGCALNGWAVAKKHSSYLIAKALGIESNNDKQILEQLQGLTVEDLCKEAEKLGDLLYIGKIRAFGPVVETTSSNTFLNKRPIDIITSGNYHKVPLIMGCCSREGMYLYHLYTSTLRKKNRLLADETIIPHYMNLRKGSPSYKLAAKHVKNFYFGDGDSLRNKDDIFRLYTDNCFLLDVYNSARYHSKMGNVPVFFYMFCLDTGLNFVKKLYSIEYPGVCHSDDVGYLFRNNFSPDTTPGSVEDIAIRRMTKLWTNFAKYGNPTPSTSDELLCVTWKPVTPTEFNFLNIAENLEMKIDPEKKAMDFWNKLMNVASLFKTKL